MLCELLLDAAAYIDCCHHLQLKNKRRRADYVLRTTYVVIPGILEREQEQSVVYGSIDFGKTVVTHPKYMDLLQKAGSQLKILPHSVINDKKLLAPPTE